MTGRRRTRTPATPAALAPAATGRAPARLRAAALTVCAALAAGCGVLPGTSDGSDSPITVMTWAPENTRATNLPGVPAMARAYARWVNAEGGIAGRELKVITCNDHNDSGGAAACARRAVSQDVVAVVGSYSQHTRSFLSPLEMAGIPYIGGYGVTEGEFTSPLSYPVNGGQPALVAGMGRQLAGRCSVVALVRPDTFAGDSLPLLLDAGLPTGRRESTVDVRAAEEATDYTRQVREALEEVSAAPRGRGCVAAALGDRTRTFFDSFRRIHAAEHPSPSVRVGAVFGSVDQSTVDSTGGRSGPYEGAQVTGWYPVSSDPRWAQMRRVIGKHAFDDNRIDPSDAGVQTTWIAYTVLRQVIESLEGGEVSARAVRNALDNGLKVGTGGLTPTLSWRFEDMLAVKDYPRVVNANVTFQTVRDGRLVAARPGSVSMAETLEGAPAPG
ncbi:ABC transporter substrate-binding protein [Streptomyces sp. NPDC059816]|uniref:ABC transporter substrate-binding protein n=1 Tax=Streptomyces sp. NPDC059816 TaxID=3346960 RepID=UPI00364B3BFC